MHVVKFFLGSCAWALVGIGVLQADIAAPIVVAIVWLVGFVWLAGWLAVGPREGDMLLLYWLAMMGGFAAIGGAIYAMIWLFT
jgi:hypothetical protein